MGEKEELNQKIVEHLQEYFKEYAMLSKDEYIGIVIHCGKEIKDEKVQKWN